MADSGYSGTPQLKKLGTVPGAVWNAIRNAALARRLVDVKVAAVDADWSGLELVGPEAGLAWSWSGLKLVWPEAGLA